MARDLGSDGGGQAVTERSQSQRTARTIGKVSVAGALACLACLLPWFVGAVGLTSLGLVSGLGVLGTLSLVSAVGAAVVLRQRSGSGEPSDPDGESPLDSQAFSYRDGTPLASPTAGSDGSAAP